jgi:isorenieratene synthase
MLRTTTDARGRRLYLFGRPLPPAPEEGTSTRPDWMQARAPAIRQALEQAQALPHGGWYVLDAARRIGTRPAVYWVAGQELVAWRDGPALRGAPNACPHLGAPLSAGRVQDGRVVCPWHGLALGSDRHGAWAPLTLHDDGVLAWVRLGPEDPAVPAPVLAPRPAQHLDGVIRMLARCAPEDVIANRLDPWHGAHFHPHSFARLRVIGEADGVLTVRVAFRVAGPLAVEVDCTFHCPDPRTIVMTIVAGEGLGSVVETHATPVVPGWTAIVEVTLATSDQEGFAHALAVRDWVRPLIERTARRLWVEDAAYAERTAWLRDPGSPAPWFPPSGPGTPGQPAPGQRCRCGR